MHLEWESIYQSADVAIVLTRVHVHIPHLQHEQKNSCEFIRATFPCIVVYTFYMQSYNHLHDNLEDM